MKIKILHKLKNINFTKRSKIIFVVFIFLGLSLAAPVIADTGWATKVMAGLLSVIISMLGWILILIVNTLISIASWSLFIKSSAVSFGWTVVRDLCNMFFIVIMLAIAFGTILNIEQFNYKKLLPKLILMAILINFSKIICGLLIDVAQVVMLTFVNSFASFGAGSLLDNLGVEGILKLSRNSETVGFWTVLAAYLLGIIYILVAIVVCIAMIAMLGIRIVMIWIYVVLSPLAYLLSAFPPGQKFASQWWSEFGKNLIVGPVLAFFLWLSLVSLQADNMNTENAKRDNASKEQLAADLKNINLNDNNGEITDANELSAVTEASSPGALIKFVIAIGMLLGGLQISSQIGGIAGSMAGKGMQQINKAASAVGKAGTKKVGRLTGASYVSGVYKSYKSGNESRRQAKYKDHADLTSGVIGKVKRNANPIHWAAMAVGTDRKTRKVEATMDRNKDQIETAEGNFSTKQGQINLMDDVTRGYKYNEDKKEWRNKKNKKEVLTNEQMEERKKNQEESQVFSNIADTDDWVNKRGDKVNKIEMEELVKQKKEKSEEINKEDEKKLSKITGGPVLIKKLLKSTYSNGGIERSSDRRAQNVQEKQKKYEKNSDVELESAINNKTLSATDRAAASLVALDRKSMSEDKRKAIKDRLMQGEGLGGSRNGVLNDKKLGTLVKTSIASGDTAATSKLIEKAGSADLVVSEKAKADIRSAFQNGKLLLNSMSASGIRRVLPEFIAALKPKQISEAISGIKNKSEQNGVISALQDRIVENKDPEKKKLWTEEEKANRNLESNKVMAALTPATDIKTATENAENQKEARLEIMKNMESSTIVNMFYESSGKQKNALIEAVKETGAKLEDFETSLEFLKGRSPRSVQIVKSFGWEPASDRRYDDDGDDDDV